MTGEEKIPSFMVVASDTDNSEVFAISTVHDPAIAMAFVAFSDANTFNVCLASEEKMRLTGPVLVPDMPILRHMPELKLGVNGYFNMVFSADVIETLAKKFARNGNLLNTTEDHKTVTSNYVFESWLVEDPATDKSAAMGFKDVKKGTWFVTMQVTDKTWWDDNIKTNKFRGFSVEMLAGLDISTALASHVEAELRNENDKTHKLDITNMTYTLADGTVIEISALEVGGTVADAEGNPVADGNYVLEDNSSIDVEAGLITAVNEAATEEVEEVEEVEMTVEFNAETVATMITDALSSIVARLEALEGVNAELSASNAELVNANAELSAQVLKLAETPAPSKIEGTVTKSPFKVAMERVQYLKSLNTK